MVDEDIIKILEQERDNVLLKLNLLNQTIVAYRESHIALDGVGNIQLNDEGDNEKRISLLIDKYYSYNKIHPIRKKVLTIIKNENRFLHVREIARIAHQLETDVSVNTFIKKISPALSSLKNLPGSGIVSVVVAKSHFNTFWGSRSWLDEHGNIITGHIYNENQLSWFNKEKYSI